MNDIPIPVLIFWVALFVVSAARLVSAAILRPKFREMRALADSLYTDPVATKSDRKVVLEAVSTALDRKSLVVGALFVPILPFVAFWAALIGWWQDTRPQVRRKSIPEAAEDLELISMSALLDVKACDLKLWSDPRRTRLSGLAFEAQTLGSPIAAAILLLAILPAGVMGFSVAAMINALGAWSKVLGSAPRAAVGQFWISALSDRNHRAAS